MLVILLGKSAGSLWSQTKPSRTNYYFEARAGFLGGYTNLVDKYYTELPYTGSSLGGMVGFTYHKDNIVHDLEFTFDQADASIDTKPEYKLNQNYFKGTYTFLYQFSEEPNGRLQTYGGGSIDFLDANRTYNQFANNYQTYEFSGTLNLVFRIDYLVSESFRLTLGDQLRAPFFAMVKQPELGGETGEMKFGTWSLWQGVGNRFYAQKAFGKQHHIALDYRLEYYAIHTDREVTQVHQAIGISYGYHF